MSPSRELISQQPSRTTFTFLPSARTEEPSTPTVASAALQSPRPPGRGLFLAKVDKLAEEIAALQAQQKDNDSNLLTSYRDLCRDFESWKESAPSPVAGLLSPRGKARKGEQPPRGLQQAPAQKSPVAKRGLPPKARAVGVSRKGPEPVFLAKHSVQELHVKGKDGGKAMNAAGGFRVRRVAIRADQSKEDALPSVRQRGSADFAPLEGPCDPLADER